MGQAVAAVALGIIKTNKLDKEIRKKLQDEDGDWKDGIDEDVPNAYSSMTDRFNVLGFVVASGGADSYDCPDAREDIPDLPFGDAGRVATLIGPKYISAGRKKWDAFAEFAKKNGVDLPEPTLILTEVEIA